MKKIKWIVMIIILAVFIAGLFCLELFKPSMLVFAEFEAKKIAFHTTETGLNLTQVLYADTIQFAGTDLTVRAQQVKIGSSIIPVTGQLSILNGDTITISNPDGQLRVKKVIPSQSCIVSIVRDEKTLELKFTKGSDFSINGLIESGLRIVISKSRGMIVSNADNTHFAFYPDDRIEIAVSRIFRDLSIELTGNESLIKLYLDDQQNQQSFPVIKNSDIRNIQLYDDEPTGQAGWRFLASTVTRGKVELSTRDLFGQYFLFQEQPIQAGELVMFAPDAVYFLKELTCAGNGLSAAMYDKHAKELFKGKSIDLLQSIFPTWLEWIIREPVTKKVWLLVTAVTGLIFLIPKIKDFLFPKVKADENSGLKANGKKKGKRKKRFRFSQ
jgi:hypothetical protein